MDVKVDKDSRDGCRVEIRPDELEQTNFRVLSSSVRFKTDNLFIQKEQPMDLLFLRVIFSHLRRQTINDHDKENGDDETLYQDTLPFEAFQRAFERMFFVLRDPLGFDARPYDENGDGFVTWCEFFHVYTQRNMTIHVSLLERIYLTIDNPDTCKLAGWVSAMMLSTIIVSSLCFILRTVPECHTAEKPQQCLILGKVEDVCLMLFVIEYAVRLCTCWAVRSEIFDKTEFHNLVVGFEPIHLPSPFVRLWRFVFTPANLIDFAAILPTMIGWFVNADGGAFVVLRLIRLTRIFRALKSPAFVAPVQVIARTVHQSTKALYVLMFNLCLGIVIFGSLMYMAEGGNELETFGLGGKWNSETLVFERVVGRTWDNSNAKWVLTMEESPFQSIPHAFWWAITTVTTVGYGDYYPTTSLGYVVAVSTMVFSLVILALPIGIIGNNFKQEWDNYETKRRTDAEALEAEMRFITSAIKTLDPFRMSRLVLIEVWHDNPSLPQDLPARSPPSSFMGEAKLELDLSPDKPMYLNKTLRLEENLDLVKRSVSGKITVQIEWHPELCPKDEDTEEDDEAVDETTKTTSVHRASRRRSGSSAVESISSATSSVTQVLRGSLKVTLVSGDGLINLNCGRPEDGSSPYCLVLCYPTFGTRDRTPVPFAWRSPGCRNTLSPKWNSTHTFSFRWARHTVNTRTALAELDEDGVSRRSLRLSRKTHGSLLNEGSHGHEHQRETLRMNTNTSQQASQPDTTSIVKLDEALGLLHEFAQELRQQRADIKQVREDVRTLSSRVDRISEATTTATGEASMSPSPLLPHCVPSAE